MAKWSPSIETSEKLIFFHKITCSTNGVPWNVASLGLLTWIASSEETPHICESVPRRNMRPRGTRKANGMMFYHANLESILSCEISLHLAVSWSKKTTIWGAKLHWFRTANRTVITAIKISTPKSLSFHRSTILRENCSRHSPSPFSAPFCPTPSPEFGRSARVRRETRQEAKSRRQGGGGPP